MVTTNLIFSTAFYLSLSRLLSGHKLHSIQTGYLSSSRQLPSKRSGSAYNDEAIGSSPLSFSHENPQHIPLMTLSPTFSNSLLLFRGDTTLFSFVEIQQLGVPYVHIPSSSVNNEIRIFYRLKPSNITNESLKTITNHVVVFGLSSKTRPIFGGSVDLSRETQTILSMFPQTVIGLSKINNPWTFQSIFDAYSSAGIFITFLLAYDPKSGENQAGYISCKYCMIRAHLDLLPLYRHTGTQTMRFYWNQEEVVQQMELARKNITEGGANVAWLALSSYDHEFYLGRELISGNEFIPAISPPVQPAILRLYRFHVAAMKVLFPERQGTYAHETCWLLTDCLRYQSPRERQDKCTGRGILNCNNRGIRDTAVEDSMKETNLALKLEVGFHRSVLKDEQVIFITSEQVRYRSGDSAVDIFLKIYAFAVWLALVILVMLTGFLLTVTARTAEPKTNCSDNGILAKLQTKGSETMETVACISVGFLAQHPRSLPLATRKAGNRRHMRLLRLYLVPWIFGTWFLTSWYMAFMRSSFNFPFPYELQLTNWRDFENFSLYLFMDRRKDVSEFYPDRGRESYKYNLRGSWFYPCDRQLMLWDLNNFEDQSQIQNCAKNLTEHIPVAHEMAIDEFALAGLHPFEFVSMYNRSLQVHPVIQWFKFQVDRGIFSAPCFNQSIMHSNETVERVAKCNLDLVIWAKMQKRFDIILPQEIASYFGSHYRNLTVQGRKIGLALIRKVGKELLSGIMYYPKTYGFKRNYIAADEPWNVGNIFYWMTRRPEAAFVVSKSEFPWYWNLFKKIMLQDPAIKFAHTGPKELKKLRPGGGFGGTGFESPIEVIARMDYYAPEARWMQRRIRALQHSGIFGFLAKWDLMLYPPVKMKHNEFLEETAGGVQALSLAHDEVKAIFTVFVYCSMLAAATFMAELTKKVFRYLSAVCLN